MKSAVICALATVLLFTLGLQTTNYAEGQLVSQTAPSVINIDLTGTPYASDETFGITCDESGFIYQTIDSHGGFVKIDKSNLNSYSVIAPPVIADGKNWYSVVGDGNGNLYTNERDNGIMWKYNISSGTYTKIIVAEEITDPDVSYTVGYDTDPTKVTVAPAFNVNINMVGFGQVIFANGYIWQVISYSSALSTFGSGLADNVSVHQLVKIDPASVPVGIGVIHAVDRFNLGVIDVRGVVADGNILWITSQSESKIVKFDTVTETSTIISLDPNSEPRGVVADSTYVYVALNKPTGGNSEILRITKSNTAEQIIIDTGASNTNRGTFNIFSVNTAIIWTDESGHYGTFDTSNPVATMTVTDVSGSGSNYNHFGCAVENQVYFAGAGSIHNVSFSLGFASDVAHGDSCAGDCYSPHFGVDENNVNYYSDGLMIDSKPYKMDNVLHVHNDKIIETKVGTPINFTMKIQDTNPDDIMLCEMGFGIKKGNFIINDASFLMTIRKSFDGILDKSITGDLSALKNPDMSYRINENNVYCSFVWTPTKHLTADMFAVQAIDQYGYNKITFVNEGHSAVGISLVGTPMYDVMDSIGHIETVAIIDQTLVDQTKAIDTHGNRWTLTDNHWIKDFIMPDLTGSLSYNSGYDRYDVLEFTQMKKGQELLARQYFDSSLIQSSPERVIEKEYVVYPRLHDPVPNMMKARADYEIAQVQNQ